MHTHLAILAVKHHLELVIGCTALLNDSLLYCTATLYLVWSCSVPREVRFQHDISPRCAYRLASTCWANGQLEVIPSLTSSETTDGAKSTAADLHCDGTTQTRQADASLVMAGGSAFQTNTS